MPYLLIVLLLGVGLPAAAEGQQRNGLALLPTVLPTCPPWEPGALPRGPTVAELRCRHRIQGPGRFGLGYAEVPVYQPVTPLPGTHIVGVPGLPRPAIGESYEAWEWRMLRTQYPRDVLNVHRALELLDPLFAERLMRFERRLAQEGIRFSRRETWRSWDRQAYLFQQGRSRPGFFATTTLTSWHCRVDEQGLPASRAADYNVAPRQMPRFHEIAGEVGLESYGADSNDPGHVYLPVAEQLEEAELILLRTLPRVPVVTLATGRPVDEWVPRGMLPELRSASWEFASEPFLPSPQVKHAGAGMLLLLWSDSVEARVVPEPPRERRRATAGVLDRFFCEGECGR